MHSKISWNFNGLRDIDRFAKPLKTNVFRGFPFGARGCTTASRRGPGGGSGLGPVDIQAAVVAGAIFRQG